MQQPALGIDLGGTKVEALLLAADGSPRWRQRVATPAGDYEATVRTVAALVDAARREAGAGVTLGVGAPGSVGANGRMKNCNSTCLNGRPLAADLRAAVGQPLALANDADCLALSEATDGAGAGERVVFAVILGTGTGAGIAVDGRVLQGPNGIAGEWGHNPLPWAVAGDDPVFDCYCGQQGCIETHVSGPAIARDHALHAGRQAAVEATPTARTAAEIAALAGTARPPTAPTAAEIAALAGTARPPTAPTAAEIAALAAAGDPACRATLDRHAHRLARALASVINLLDPDVIVVGGGVSRWPGLYRSVPALWSRWVFAAGADAGAAVRTRLVAARHGDASGVRGAAWLGRTAQAGTAPS